MDTNLKIGYFAHWNQPPYPFSGFLQEQGITAEKINYSQENYLEKYDVVIIEQNGFNDYIENDEAYIHDWVNRGGILFFMHQDYQRWAPYFLPDEVGYTQLIHRYIPTIGSDPIAIKAGFAEEKTHYMTYMMPWIEEPGRRLFSEPESISPEEMLNWRIGAHSFRIIRIPTQKDSMETIRTAAESCFLANPNWEILGSYMDPAVQDGALILKANYGRGMFFLNQILFPELNTPEAEGCFQFWKKYLPNLLAYFQRFKNGESETLPPKKKQLPVKKNYKLTTHMHSLDWYGCDASPGTVNALMRYMNYDICGLALKDNAPYKGKLSTEKFSDDHVLFLDGQEFHPFNWNDKYDHIAHACYHMLSIGVDPNAYTPKYTRSYFSDAQLDAYVKEAIEFIHEHHGAACATHPLCDYWHDYPYDAVDFENMESLEGTGIERFWLSGKKITVLNSVDLFGTRRMYDNPAVNFIYLNGETPSRDSVVKAICAGHTIASAGFDEADMMLNDHIPGDEVSPEEAAQGTLFISGKISRGRIRKVRVYSGDRIIFSKEDGESQTISLNIPLEGLPLQQFIRVELEGENSYWCCNSTPFYLKN